MESNIESMHNTRDHVFIINICMYKYEVQEFFHSISLPLAQFGHSLENVLYKTISHQNPAHNEVFQIIHRHTYI